MRPKNPALRTNMSAESINREALCESVDEAAARWTARLDGGRMTSADRIALHAWLDESPAHRVAFERYQLICDDTAEGLPLLARVSPVARPNPQPRCWAPFRWAAAAGIAAAMVFAALWAVSYNRNVREIATIVAQRSTISLPDGTSAHLNAATRLSTDFRGGRRIIKLEHGEAYFSVVSDPRHPFVVATPAGTVRVTGTEFNVRLVNGRPEVTLIEGGVQFLRGSERIDLQPGQQLAVDGARRDLSPHEVDRVVAWREGRIVLTGLTLAEAARQFSEFHGKSISVAPEIMSLELGGSRALDDLTGFLQTVSSEPLGFRVIRRDANHFAIVPGKRE